MEKKDATPKKRPFKPFRGVLDGVSFSKDNQPTPEQKRKGWQEIRKERHLTQSIIKAMIGKDGKPNDTFKDYLKSLIDNAKLGNTKAIDAVNKCIEDEIIKVAQTTKDGDDVVPVEDKRIDEILTALRKHK